MVAFDPKKCTQKTTECINAAVSLAEEEGHATLTPVHLACVLFEVGTGVALYLAVVLSRLLQKSQGQGVLREGRTPPLPEREGAGGNAWCCGESQLCWWQVQGAWFKHCNCQQELNHQLWRCSSGAAAP